MIKSIEPFPYTVTMTDSELRERYDRAQTEEMNAYIRGRDPMIVEVDNEDSGTTHTVLPESLYCGCEDHRYRDTICKHLLYLGHQDWSEEVANLVVDALDAEHSETVEESLRLERELEDLKEEQWKLFEAMELVNGNDAEESIREWIESLHGADGGADGEGETPFVPGPVGIEETDLEDVDVNADELVEELDEELVEEVDNEAEELIEEMEAESSEVETVEGLTMEVVE